MPKIIEGTLQAGGLKFGLVVGRFNHFLSDHLLDGALDCLRRHGASEEDLMIVRVPGSFEIPVAVSNLISRGGFDGIIALGVLIRGATPHFDYIAAEVTKGLGQLALQHSVPVAYGIITADTIEQAIERAGTKAGNKGWDAAQAAIEMARVIREIQNG